MNTLWAQPSEPQKVIAYCFRVRFNSQRLSSMCFYFHKNLTTPTASTPLVKGVKCHFKYYNF